MIDLEFYSPVQQLTDPLFVEKEIEVYIKRDDLIHPFISGNKWRKLKYILRKAQIEKKNHLVTFGGAYSNHLLATACAAAKFGFKSTGVVRGEPVENDVLMFCQLFGMQLQFISRENYRDKVLYFTDAFKNDLNAYFIDEGGASPEAVQGSAELIDELQDNYNHIFCASGTGTTVAGLIKGIKHKKLDSNIHSVPVLKNGSFLKQDISKYLNAEDEFQIHLDYHFGGYAKTEPELLNFIKKFASAHGILLDPVYTGKLFFAIYDLINKDFFKKNEKILAVHTGGLFGILGMSEKFRQLI